jgi:hypothetical protein
MTNWTEFQIAIVYYSGLLLSIVTALSIIFYLNPLKPALIRIVTGFENFWGRGFKTSLILAGLLGAMSVSFKDCSGNYDYLINSPEKTLLKGSEQISSAFAYLAFLLGLWLIVFVLLRFAKMKKKT